MEVSKQPVEGLTLGQAIQEWWLVDQHRKEVQARELALRSRIFGEAFPAPTEGSANNKMPLDEGWILQGDYKINRNVDEAMVVALRAMGDNVATIVDSVIKWKPELKLKEWKALDAETRKLLAEMVIEKPGTPALEVKLPKR